MQRSESLRSTSNHRIKMHKRKTEKCRFSKRSALIMNILSNSDDVKNKQISKDLNSCSTLQKPVAVVSPNVTPKKTNGSHNDRALIVPAPLLLENLHNGSEPVSESIPHIDFGLETIDPITSNDSSEQGVSHPNNSEDIANVNIEQDENSDLFSSDDSQDPNYVPSSENFSTPSSGYSDSDNNDDDKESSEISNLSKEIKSISFPDNDKKKRKKVKSPMNFYDKKSKMDKSSDVFVGKTRRNMNGYIIRNKRHCCLYCNKLVLNFSRHLEKVHSTEIAVGRLLAMPKKYFMRRKGFIELSRIGDFYFNCETLEKKEGELILVRRPTKEEEECFTYKDYGPCPDCLGFMLRKHIWRHLKSGCYSNSNVNNKKCLKDRQVISESKSLLASITLKEQPKEFRDYILLKLRDDNISSLIKEDKLICKFGLLQFEKYGSTQCELIRQQMRQMGRLLLELRNICPTKKDLQSWLQPDNFDDIISAVKTVAKLGDTESVSMRPNFEIPSLALKLGHHIRKCIGIDRGIALRNSDKNRNEILQQLLHLMDLEWSAKISSNALASLYNRKINSAEILPLTEDLVKLNKYIETEMTNIMNKFENDNIKLSWKRLCTLTLSKLILFNKRRSGEASRMRLFDFDGKPNLEQTGTDELKKSLTAFEKKISERLCLVEIIGKRGKKVPLLLTPILKQAIEKLIENREVAGIARDNPYVFACAGGSLGHMRGHDCIKTLTSEISLKLPNLINATKLRKYIATVCQVFNLTETESDWLARHLGHDIRVHRDFYRLHESAVETTKISRLLIAVEQGRAHEFAGKELKDINVNDLLDIEMPIDNDSDIDDEEDVNKKGNQDDGAPTELDDTLIMQESGDETSATDNNYLTTDMKRHSNGKSGKKQKVVTVKNPWSKDEKTSVLLFFKLLNKNQLKVPGKEACEKCIRNSEGILKNRSWRDVKYYVYNYIKKVNKKKN